MTIHDVNITDFTSSPVTKQVGIAIKSTNPVVRFLVTIPRPKVDPGTPGTSILFDSDLSILIE